MILNRFSSYARWILLIGTPVIVLGFIGAVYFQIYMGSKATRSAWILTHDVAAGGEITTNNAQLTQVGEAGTQVLLFQGDLVQDHRHASHAMRASHLLAPDDLTPSALVLAPISFAFAPQLQSGDQIDVYLENNGQVVQVGRNLVVETSSSVWVPAPDEASWISLQASKAILLAVRSNGAGVPLTNPLGTDQAVSELTASAAK